MSLKWKLVIMCLVIALLPLGVMAGLSFIRTKEALKKMLLEELYLIAEFRESEVFLYVEGLKTISKNFASDGLIKHAIEALYDEHFGGISAVEILNNHLLKNKVPLHKDLVFIDVTDTEGNVVASSIPGHIGLERWHEGHPYERLEGPHVADMKKELDYVGIEVVAPVKGVNDNTKVIGFLVLNFNTSTVSDLLRGDRVLALGALTQIRGIGKTGEVYLVNADRLMVTDSLSVKNAAFKQKADTYPVQRCLEQDEEVVGAWRNYRGVDVAGASMCINIGDFRWVLLAEQDEREAFAVVNNLGHLFLLIGFSTIVFVGFVALLTAQAVYRPINRLTQFASRISKEGRPSGQIIGLDRGDEIGVLTTAFNTMISSLKMAMDSLDERNKTISRNMNELEKVNAELDRFVYVASHDLRAPLRGISSFATFLEEDYKDRLDKEGKDYLAEIRKGVDRLDALIESLLELSKISRIRNPYESVDTRDLIMEVIGRLKHEIAAHRVEVEVAEHMPTICCDRIKISEVFFNLIHNAIKFSAKNTMRAPKVGVGYSDEGTHHQFYVRDNGIGIAPRYQEQIFQVFQRLHTETEYEGTGMGLTIVQKILEEHGGKIRVDSKEEAGATFYFTLSKSLQSRCNRCKNDLEAASCPLSSSEEKQNERC